ncbi:prepilin-type N-terminal cleavage/methylation domain-containing protein [Desulfuromonas acetoxidans]|uniref:Prepilin-type N-terminal cleavage/methylation domain-containing protein n=1 Tax=Desulfuromonas acetoxidans (strain DSM 684 / 11070) TaxID=281689 RepID=Q1JVH6_DESA6|nr:prepilin-type N-terminal cleavage/methylation domain-containing protein [Desulfuromonas acetoxidans]EAT14237.1 conserved hypothetical protein [Desulfuromonas acetoxidans DSM 684]MBF0645807.1 prepilin-type N-terminal cleavage/methylation domain-containing protein [Desulfuromonas acetoxidans]NVD24805.1 prepilin-type N-terminal cleavage/methylation domain-containing protein [Desulfuromonas acetoxidans]NVE16850.1 prepilin-type N-terminal cleavage/methylation domain-containing protein [Desulfurom
MLKAEHGFSLIELMIALLILAVGLLSLAGLQGVAIEGNRQGNLISQATALAENRIERIQSEDYDAVNDVTFPAVDNGIGINGYFDRTTLIENDVPLVGLKRITVTVSWSDGEVHQVELRTIVSNEG